MDRFLSVKRNSDQGGGSGAGAGTGSEENKEGGEKKSRKHLPSILDTFKNSKNPKGSMVKILKELETNLSAEREKELYEAVKAAYQTFKNLDTAVKKIKPDVKYFDANGKVVLEAYSDAQYKLLKAAKEKFEKYANEFDKAANPDEVDIDKLIQLSKQTV